MFVYILTGKTDCRSDKLLHHECVILKLFAGEKFLFSVFLYFIINEIERRLYSPYYSLKTKMLGAQLVTAVGREVMCKKFANFQS